MALSETYYYITVQKSKIKPCWTSRKSFFLEEKIQLILSNAPFLIRNSLQQLLL